MLHALGRIISGKDSHILFIRYFKGLTDKYTIYYPPSYHGYTHYYLSLTAYIMKKRDGKE